MADKKSSLRATCPVCGRKEKWTETFTVKLKTATICDDCAEKMRVRYPLIYKLNPKWEITYERATYHSGVLGRAEQDTDISPTSNGEPKYIVEDDLKALTLTEFKKQFNELDAFKAAIRHQYGDYNSVFEVVAVKRCEANKDQSRSVKKMDGSLVVLGMVKVGSFEKGDNVNVVHEGQTQSAYITSSFGEELGASFEDMAENLYLTDRHDTLVEGHPGKLILDLSVTELAPGDYIGKD